MIKEEAVLEAAYEVFLTYGFKKVSMQEIAAAAGISRPALYLRYRSKQELFLAVIERVLSQRLAHVETALLTLTSTRERVETALDLWYVEMFDLKQSSKEARELFEVGLSFSQERLAAWDRKFEELLARQFINREDLSPAEISLVISSSVYGLRSEADSKEEFRRLIGQLLDLCGY